MQTLTGVPAMPCFASAADAWGGPNATVDSMLATLAGDPGNHARIVEFANWAVIDAKAGVNEKKGCDAMASLVAAHAANVLDAANANAWAAASMPGRGKPANFAAIAASEAARAVCMVASSNRAEWARVHADVTGRQRERLRILFPAHMKGVDDAKA